MTLPTIFPRWGPSSSMLTKSPAAGMKVSRVPASTPGIDIGSVTVRKVVIPLAYRSPPPR